MNMIPFTQKHTKVRGLATIELLLVTPILVLVIAAISELGWAFHDYKTLTRATRDGMRYVAGEALRSGVGIVIIDPTLEQETRYLVVYGSASGGGEPLLRDLSVADVRVFKVDSQHVSVEAQYQYRPYIFASLPFMNGTSLTFQMQSSMVMRAL
jgi:hypothetical protein